MSTFEGIPVATAAAFYAELEENNTRDWWQAHSAVYQASVKEPLDCASGPAGTAVRTQQDLPAEP